MRNPTIIAVALIVLFLPPRVVNAGKSWTKHGHKSGVTVSTAPVEGSDVPRVRAVVTIDASPDEVWDTITGNTLKMKGLKEKKHLGSCDDRCDYIYFRMGHPLIKDRQYVVKVRSTVTEKDGLNHYRRTWVRTDDKGAVDSGALTVEAISGSWTLKPIDGGKRTRLVYVNHIDLGGNVPASLFSKGFIGNAYKLLEKIKAAH
jgi:hypothetical protein